MGGAWRTISVALKADTSGYLGPLGTASAATRKMGSEVDSSTKKAGSSWLSLNKIVKVGAAGMVLAVGAFLGASISAASKFESGMSAIGAVSGATASEMDMLREKALQLGADTSFSASEAASAMEELAKAGVPVEGIMNGAADATVALAAAGGIALPEAAAIAANAMNQFNLSASDLPGIADKIAGAANASSIDVSDFGMSMSQVGAVANLVGFSFDDTALAITAMGNAGIKGSDAGTSLKTMFMRLEPSTEKATGLMADLGIITADGSNKFFDAAGNAKSMAEVSGVLATALEGQSNQQKLATLNTLFGSDAIRGAAVVAELGADGFNKLNTEVGKVTAAEVAAERMNNLKGSLEQLSGSVETLMIKVGSNLTPFLRDAADGATTFVNAISSGDLAGTFLDPVLDAARNLEPAWRNVVDIGGDLANILGEVGGFVGPLAADMAKLAAAAGIVGLSVLASGLSSLTGFLAENEGLVRALTLALVGLAAVKGFSALSSAAETLALKFLYARDAMVATSAVQFGSTVLSQLKLIGTGLATMTSSASTGFGMIKQGASGLASAFLTPAAGIAGMAVVLAGIATAFNNAKKKGKEFADSLSDGVRYNDLESLSTAIGNAAPQVGALNDKWGGMNNTLDSLIATHEVLNPMVANTFLETKEGAEQGQAALDALRDRYDTLGDAVEAASSATGLSGDVVERWIQKLKIPEDRLGDLDYVAAKVKAASDAAATGTPATQTLTEAVAILADETANATDRMEAFKDAMDAALGIPKNLADAQREWQQSIRDTSAALYELVGTDPAAFAAGGAEAFDLLTASGLATDAAFSGLVDNGYAVAESMAAAGNSKGATDALMATRAEVIRLGESFGIPTAELEGYLQKIGLTPEQINTFVQLNGADAAAAEFQNVFPNELVMKVVANAVMASADSDLNNLAARTRIATVVANAITGKAEYGLRNVTDKRWVTQVILDALTNDATIDLRTVEGQERIALIVAQTFGVDTANAEIDNVTRNRIATFTAEVFTGNAEYGLQAVTDKQRVAQIIAYALAADASINLDTVAGRQRIARIIAEAFGIESAEARLSAAARERIAMLVGMAITGNADADLNTTAGRQRIADIVANAITGQAQYGLQNVTDKKRVADIIANAIAGGADVDLNTVAGRKRIAELLADANLGSAPGELDGAAKDRSSTINVDANTSKAVSAIDYAARNRDATISVAASVQRVGDWANLGKFYGGGAARPNRWGGIDSYASGGVNNITTAGVYRGDLIRFAEPETVKEAYIPFRGDAARSMAILAETASWFNAAVVPMAAGGVVRQLVAGDPGYLDDGFEANSMSSPDRGKPGAVQAEDGSWISPAKAKTYWAKPAAPARASGGGGGGGSKKIGMGQLTFKTMAAGGINYTGSGRTSPNLTPTPMPRTTMVPTGSGRGGATTVNLSVSIPINGNGDQFIENIARGVVVPTIEAIPGQVVKALTRYSDSVAR